MKTFEEYLQRFDEIALLRNKEINKAIYGLMILSMMRLQFNQGKPDQLTQEQITYILANADRISYEPSFTETKVYSVKFLVQGPGNNALIASFEARNFDELFDLLKKGELPNYEHPT